MVKINLSDLGLKRKSVEIKASLKNQKLANKITISMLKSNIESEKMNLSDDLDNVEWMKRMVSQSETDIEITEQVLGFVKDVLKLSDKEVETIEEEVSATELINFAYYVIQRLRGLSEEEVKAQKEVDVAGDEESDPKVESEG